MMKQKNENLFFNLHRWAVRQDENFTTEAYVYLLNHLFKYEPTIATNIIRKMTDGFLDLKKDQTEKINITTQTIIDEGKPDIEISTDEFLIFVEVKIDSEIGENQLMKYKDSLNNTKNKKTRLILLSRYPLTSSINGEPDYAIRWYQIADWLENELENDQINAVSKYFIDQFYGFLKKRNLTISKVKSEVSKGLKSYQKRFGDIAESLKRMRSFEKMNSDKDLHPLRDLLKLMDQALTSIETETKPRLESGKMKGGWAGYVFDRLKYALCVYYSQPENLVFETFNLKINPNKYDGELGVIWQEGKKLRWRNELNLADLDIQFFSSTKKTQLKIIEDFLKQSYQYSKTISEKRKRNETLFLTGEASQN